MSTLHTALLAAALRLPGAGQDATDREHWLSRVVSAIESAGERATCTGPWSGADVTLCERIWPGAPEELDAALLVTGYSESRLLVRIQAGRCARHECDSVILPGGRVFHRARSSWQIQASGPVSRAEWWEISGTSDVALADAAWAAARVLSMQRGRCAPKASRWIAPTLAGYATGWACGWSGAANRARMVRVVLASLEER